jgi:hypothetical protein
VCDLDPLVGTWSATTYACDGDAPTALPSGLTFTFTVGVGPGYASTFVQDDFGACVATNTGPAVCSGTYMNLPAFTFEPNAPTTCVPATCQTDCGQTPTGTVPWNYQITGSGTSRVLTTTSLPGTSLTTCTAMGKQNPITFTWSPG